MTSRIVIVTLALATSILAQNEPKWRALEKGQLDQDSKGLSVFKEWRELSRIALEADKKEPRITKVEQSFNQKANESSSTVDCGVVCNLPKIGIKIEAKMHYFFEGHTVPSDLADSMTITFNIKGTGSERRGYFIISSLVPDFITKKENAFRSRTDGMGSIDEKTWSFSLLAIMTEVDSRRLLSEGIESVHLGPFLITRPDLIHKGLEDLLNDLDQRRMQKSNKPALDNP